MEKFDRLRKLKLVQDVFPKAPSEDPLLGVPHPDRFPPNLRIYPDIVIYFSGLEPYGYIGTASHPWGAQTERQGIRGEKPSDIGHSTCHEIRSSLCQENREGKTSGFKLIIDPGDL